MTLSTSLENRNAVICGASAGIGREIALAMASQQAGVFLIARSEDKLQQLAAECLAAGAASAQFANCDLEDLDAVRGVAAQALASFGGVHILVNNSGGPPGGPILGAQIEDFLKPLHRHLFASHEMVKALLPSMEEQAYGRIINVISTSVKEPIAGLGVSNTVRGAVASWAKTLSKELPACVTINNLLPGFTATDRLDSLKSAVAERRGISDEDVASEWMASVPAKRLGDPRELAALAAFLSSPAGAYVRGQSIAVDGGRLNSI
ncbi:MAG: SDR family oxidoreductase [Planctomycetota bacterium]|nr:SDR family oxidoreductase [Planctomycetota bacterium]